MAISLLFDHFENDVIFLSTFLRMPAVLRSRDIHGQFCAPIRADVPRLTVIVDAYDANKQKNCWISVMWHGFRATVVVDDGGRQRVGNPRAVRGGGHSHGWDVMPREGELVPFPSA